MTTIRSVVRCPGARVGDTVVCGVLRVELLVRATEEGCEAGGDRPFLFLLNLTDQAGDFVGIGDFAERIHV